MTQVVTKFPTKPLFHFRFLTAGTHLRCINDTEPISVWCSEGIGLHSMVVVWRSGNIVGRINEVTLRRARLVLGWVTVFGG